MVIINKVFLIFNSFVNISWGNETQTPIQPGETREVHLIITYGVLRGIFGRMLLQILEGRSFPILVSIEDKPDWCTAWISPENITGVIMPDQILSDVSSVIYSSQRRCSA